MNLLQRWHGGAAPVAPTRHFEYPNSPPLEHLHGVAAVSPLATSRAQRRAAPPSISPGGGGGGGGGGSGGFSEEHQRGDGLGFGAGESSEFLHPSLLHFGKVHGGAAGIKSPHHRQHASSPKMQPLAGGGGARSVNLLAGSVSHMSKALVKAAREGSLERLTRAFDAGADPNVPDSHGMTAAMYAAAANNLELLRACVARGADVNAQSSTGCTPLVHAAARNHAGATRWLLALKQGFAGATLQPARAPHAADPNLRTARGFTALATAVCAGHLEIVALLLGSPHCAVDAPDNEGWTPLHHAAKEGFLDAVQLLVRGGADAELVDEANRTAMLVARQHGHENIYHHLHDIKSSAEAAGGTAARSGAFGVSRPPWVSVVDMRWSSGALPRLKDDLKHFGAAADKTGDPRYTTGKPLSTQQQHALAREKRHERRRQRKAAGIKRARKQRATSERKRSPTKGQSISCQSVVAQ